MGRECRSVYRALTGKICMLAFIKLYSLIPSLLGGPSRAIVFIPLFNLVFNAFLTKKCKLDKDSLITYFH